MKRKLIKSMILAVCLILLAIPSERASGQAEEVMFDGAAYGELIFEPIPKAPVGIDPKVAEWWNKSQLLNEIAKRIAEQGKKLVNLIVRHTADRKGMSHPDIVQWTMELEQVEKKRAELKKQFIDWLREGSENSYPVPLPDAIPKPFICTRMRYTEAARSKRVTGMIKLDMIFHKDGVIDTIRVVHSLPDGLTDYAIYAAKLNIFIPSVKDGKFRSVRGQVEYLLDLY
ncbi:MAG: energy transducer TonB [Acidobacteria bacterium]|nr:energy transducer TonB [Acidobacteriota bacterium]MCW5967940.1 energy transducer TonB [Blastocatellales bacterium]